MAANRYRVWATGRAADMQRLDAALADGETKRLTVYDVLDLKRFSAICERLGIETDVLYAHKGQFRDPKAANRYQKRRRAIRERYRNGEIFRPCDLRESMGLSGSTVTTLLKIMAAEGEVVGYGNGKARFFKMVKSLREEPEE